MKTHISYECSKKIKEFLGESAPEPMGGGYWTPMNDDMFLRPKWEYGYEQSPAYQLHDLLSRAFCEAMESKRGVSRELEEEAMDLAYELQGEYYSGGLPAVEKALIEMMGGQNGK